MKVLVTGASGLVGTELIAQLRANGDQAIALVRRAAKNENELAYVPGGTAEQNAALDSAMKSADAVVNLAGATTGKLPWTKSYKKELIESRLGVTQTLVDSMKRVGAATVFVSGSASGFYGDTGDANLHEDAPRGAGFLADLASQWEAIALGAPKSVRAVLIRTTMVCSRTKGALGRLLPLLRLGVGGRLGSGKQWWAFISVVDEARAIRHLIATPKASGAYNLTAPQPATCAQLVYALGKAMHRPTILPVPAFALRLAFGEGADELLLCSQKMSADKLLATGFEFKHPTLETMAQYVLGKTD